MAAPRALAIKRRLLSPRFPPFSASDHRSPGYIEAQRRLQHSLFFPLQRISLASSPLALATLTLFASLISALGLCLVSSYFRLSLAIATFLL